MIPLRNKYTVPGSPDELVNPLPGYSPYPATSTLYAVHPYQRFIPPKVKVFVDFLRDRFSQHYDWSLPRV
jgi:DNA-binding transcriptional LysR family regulator